MLAYILVLVHCLCNTRGGGTPPPLLKKVIKQATDKENLAQMYWGWAPYLLRLSPLPIGAESPTYRS